MRSILPAAILLVLASGHGATPGARAAAQTVPPPDVQGVPAAQAPDDLGLIQLPDTAGAVANLFKQLPAQVAGHARGRQFDRVSPQGVEAGYGEEAPINSLRRPLLYLRAVNLTIPDFFPPNWTGGEVVAFMAGKEAADAGRDGALFWMRNETAPSPPGSTEPVRHGMLWGRVDSSWLFSVQADTPEHRDALVRAFVATARSAFRE